MPGPFCWLAFSRLTRLPGGEARCYGNLMLTRLRRLFTIKTKFEAFAVVYALGLGAADRGIIYMAQYPGFMGKLLALCCGLAVMMAGGKIIDAVDLRAQLGYED